MQKRILFPGSLLLHLESLNPGQASLLHSFSFEGLGFKY